MFCDIFDQVSIEHPFRNKLEGSGSDTQEGDDVSVCRMFPYYNLLVEGLRVSSATASRERDKITRFRSFRRAALGVYANAFDANIQSLALMSPLVHIPRTSRGDQPIMDDQRRG